jgi:hypothetical protein
MAERKTLISRGPSSAPVVAQSNLRVPSGMTDTSSSWNGVIDAGRAVQRVGEMAQNFANNSADQQRAAAARLAAETARRESHDSGLILENSVRRSAAAIDQEIADNAPSWDAGEIVQRTDEIIQKHRSNFDTELAAMQEKNPALAKYATGDEVENQWGRYKYPIIERAHVQQAEKVQNSRELNTTEAVTGRLNGSGTNLPLLMSEAARSQEEVTKQNRSLYGQVYRDTFTSKVISPAVTNALQAAVIENKGFTPEIKAWADKAHEVGWLSTEAHANLMKTASVASEVSRAEANRRVDEAVDAISGGRTPFSPQLMENIVQVSQHPNEPTMAKAVRDRVFLAGAEGVVAKRVNEGQFAFPFAASVAASTNSPTIFQTQEILKGNDPDKVRGLVLGLMKDMSEAKDLVSNATNEDIGKFQASVLKRVNDQLALPLNRVAENAPNIRAVATNDPNSIPATLQAYQAWYDANGVPAERQILVHQPHLDYLNQLWKQGDMNNFKQVATGVSALYGKLAPVAFARALAADESSRPYAAALRIIGQSANSSNPHVQKGIREFGESLIDAASVNVDEIEKTHPGTSRIINEYLNQAGHQESGGPMAVPAWANIILPGASKFAKQYTDRAPEPFYRADSTQNDQTISNVITSLGNDGEGMSLSMRESLAKVIMKKAYGSGGQSTSDVAKETQNVANAITRAFMVVRTNGRFSPQPGFVLMTPDSQRRGSLDNFVMGPESGQATSVKEDAETMAQAIDAVMLNGLDDSKYKGLLGGQGWLGHLDNYLGASAAQVVGWRINGFENRSAAYWKPLDNRPAAKVPDSLKLDWASMTTFDGTPVADHPMLANETLSLKAKTYYEENVKGSPGLDLHTRNQQAISKNSYFVQLPSGDLQLFVLPAARQYENVTPGTRGTGTPIYSKGKPVIISFKALKAFRDQQRDLRASTTTLE